MAPGVYYARGFFDRNGNGEWDTGNIAAKLQPEEVFYYPKRIELKKNWDIQQTWNPSEVPVDMQKPFELKKNKPKRSNQQNQQPDDDDEEEEDEWGTNFTPGSQYNERHGNNNRGNHLH